MALDTLAVRKTGKSSSQYLAGVFAEEVGTEGRNHKLTVPKEVGDNVNLSDESIGSNIRKGANNQWCRARLIGKEKEQRSMCERVA